jgi:hypothetical protein
LSKFLRCPVCYGYRIKTLNEVIRRDFTRRIFLLLLACIDTRKKHIQTHASTRRFWADGHFSNFKKIAIFMFFKPFFNALRVF